MSEKSPAEIRLQLLMIARDQLERQYYAKRDNITLATADSVPKLEDLEAVKFPSNKQIIKLAETFAEFVEK